MTVHHRFTPDGLPLIVNPDDTTVTTVGNAFHVDTHANLIGIWHYRPIVQSTTPTGAVWELGNTTPIATVTFDTSSAVGWQYKALDTPVNLDPTKYYVVGTRTTGRYACWGPSTVEGRRYYWNAWQYPAGAVKMGPGWWGAKNGPLGAVPSRHMPRPTFQGYVGIGENGFCIRPTNAWYNPSAITYPAVPNIHISGGMDDVGDHRQGDLYGSDVSIETVTNSAPIPSSGPLATAIVDDFTSGTVDKWDVTGPAPTVSGGRVTVPPGTLLRSKTWGNGNDSYVVAGFADVAPSGTDTSQAQLWMGYGTVASVVAWVVRQNGTNYVVFHYTHYGNTIQIGTFPYVPARDRYIRIVESGGLLMLETAANLNGPWLTFFEEIHPFRPGTFLSAPVQLYATGTRAAGPVQFDAVNTANVLADDPVPSQGAMDWMGATAAAVGSRWHGRDVKCAVLDQGTTASLRARHNLTLLDRQVFSGAQDPALSLWPMWNEPRELVRRPRDATYPPGNYHGNLVAADLVPPGGQFYDLIIAGYEGGASFTASLAAFKYAADQGCKVINFSYGGYTSSQAFIDAFNYLTGKDCLVFCSVGNENENQLTYPAAHAAAYPFVHAVGAVDEATSTKAYFSNYAATMTGVAPGVNIAGLSVTGKRRLWSGTSGASPNVGNIAARLLTGGLFTTTQVGDTLKATRRTLAGVPQIEQGGGAYDFAAAAALLTGPPAPPASPEGSRRGGQVASGQVPPLETWNGLAQAIDDLGVSINVRRTETAALTANVEQAVAWSGVTFSTRGGSWLSGDPTKVTITVGGTYLLVAAVRFGAAGGSGSGTRAARLCKGGTDADSTLASDRVNGSVAADGAQIVLRRTVTASPGDVITVMVSSTVSVTALHTDRGGTHLFACRLGGASSPPPTGSDVVGVGAAGTGAA